MYHPFPFLGLVPLSQLSLRAMVPKAHISTSRIRSAFALSVRPSFLPSFLPSFFLSAEVSSPQLFYDIAEETLEHERTRRAGRITMVSNMYVDFGVGYWVRR